MGVYESYEPTHVNVAKSGPFKPGGTSINLVCKKYSGEYIYTPDLFVSVKNIQNYIKSGKYKPESVSFFIDTHDDIKNLYEITEHIDILPIKKLCFSFRGIIYDMQLVIDTINKFRTLRHILITVNGEEDITEKIIFIQDLVMYLRNLYETLKIASINILLISNNYGNLASITEDYRDIKILVKKDMFEILIGKSEFQK